MPLITQSQLKSNISSKKFSRVYYFYGKDFFEAEKQAKDLISKLVPKGGEDYNLRSFEGKNLDISGLADACESLPVFADYVCVTVRDLNAEGLNAESLNRMLAIISDLPENTVLIFYNTSVDVTEGRKYPTAKNKKLIDGVSKNGTVCDFAFKTTSVLAKEIIAKCGGKISQTAATHLANICGLNSMAINNETEKLIAYSNGAVITVDDINELCPKTLDSTAFDLAKAVVKRDKGNAIRLLDELMRQKEEPVAVLYAITGSMADLYRAKTAMAYRKTSADVISDFSYAKNLSFRVENSFRDVRAMSSLHLRECMKILTETDAKMKSARTEKQTILESAIIKMLS